MTEREMAGVVMRELRSRVRRPDRGGRRAGGWLQLRNRVEPRAGGDGAPGSGDPPRDRRELFADLPAQRVQQRFAVHRVPGPRRPASRGACDGDRGRCPDVDSGLADRRRLLAWSAGVGGRELPLSRPRVGSAGARGRRRN